MKTEATKSLTILMAERIKCQKDVDERYEKLDDRLYKGVGSESSMRRIKHEMEKLSELSIKIDEEVDSLSEFMDKIK